MQHRGSTLRRRTEWSHKCLWAFAEPWFHFSQANHHVCFCWKNSTSLRLTWLPGLSRSLFFTQTALLKKTETKWRTVIAVQYLHSGFLLKEGRGFYFLFTHILRFLVDIYVCCLKREDSLPRLSRVTQTALLDRRKKMADGNVRSGFSYASFKV